MKLIRDHFLIMAGNVLLFFNIGALATGKNLSCYQCIRTEDVECDESDLRPCPPSKDRCVIHTTKDELSGFQIKRECGLGPCSFDDVMTSKGLGMDRACDRSKKEYNCLSCCRQSGCNKNSSYRNRGCSKLLLLLVMLVVLFVFEGFQPPYVEEKKLK